jgi:ureidoglycolate hydrolase
MVSDWIEVKSFSGEGYQPLVSYGSWRVAVLRFLKDLEPENLTTMERHALTDEVFVLIQGKAMLILGGNADHASVVVPYEMKIGDVFNVKKNTWHTIVVSHDVHIMIVENDDTCDTNSEICHLSDKVQLMILTQAQNFLAA